MPIGCRAGRLCSCAGEKVEAGDRDAPCRVVGESPVQDVEMIPGHDDDMMMRRSSTWGTGQNVCAESMKTLRQEHAGRIVGSWGTDKAAIAVKSPNVRLVKV